MKFHLIVKIWWATGSCHDDRREEISEEFNATDEKAAIKKAKIIVQKLHKGRCHLTDYGLCAKLSIISLIWEINFRDTESASPAIPARPAQPSIVAHFEEKTLR